MLKINQNGSLPFQNYVAAKGAPTIMQIVPALNAGGVEQGVIDINAAIVEAGGKSIVVSNGGTRVHEIQRAGGIHIEMPVHSKNPITMMGNIKKLKKLIAEYNVDIVHACSRAPAWSAKQAAEKTNTRFVTSVHAAHKIQNGFKRAYNSAITKGERVIVVSHFLADHLEQEYDVNPSNVRVIHRGLAVERFHPNSVTPDRLVRISEEWRIPEGAPIVFMPARLTRLKGHKFLVDALAKLKNKDIFCIMLGAVEKNSGYSQELMHHIDSKGLSAQVRIVDFCKDMPAAYMLSTVVVCPSLVPEGFGRVPVEAQAMGRPIIATDHGGTRETIVKNETGWLIEPENTDEFAEALDEAINLNVKERAILATRGMSHVAENFTVEQMCAKTLDVYAELMGAHELPSVSHAVEDAVEIEYEKPALHAR